jgi:hypothetical protein
VLYIKLKCERGDDMEMRANRTKRILKLNVFRFFFDENDELPALNFMTDYIYLNASPFAYRKLINYR